MPNTPIIPETITVHLGTPNSNAQNVTLPFLDYIANVASSEIYPTWPENAIRANVYAQVSFALNRVYTEFYRSRGYDFDITNSTAFDQAFVNGRDVFENVQQIVREIFTDYISRDGSVEPLFAQYCNGTTVTCNGLSQWGTVPLAEQGYTPYEILQYFYGDNININTNTPIGEAGSSAPEFPLRAGSSGDNVRTLQIRLNRISSNYPAIPKIPFTDGLFDQSTEEAVKEFQRIFNLTPDGIVGNATWYAVQRIYNAVKRLNELDSEGIKLSEVTKQFPGVLREGNSNIGVATLQYYLSFLSDYYNTIPPVDIDGTFGASTTAAVIDAQNTFGLTPDGIVGEETWNTLYKAYIGIVSTVPVEYYDGYTIPYQGVPLRIGSENDEVRLLQEYLNYISVSYPEINEVNSTGYFGELTQNAVIAFQNLVGIEPTGIVGALTWAAITSVYTDLFLGQRLSDGQYPGYDLSQNQ